MKNKPDNIKTKNTNKITDINTDSDLKEMKKSKDTKLVENSNDQNIISKIEDLDDDEWINKNKIDTNIETKNEDKKDKIQKSNEIKKSKKLKNQSSSNSNDVPLTTRVLELHFELNELEYPRLFDVDDNSLPEIIKKIFTYGYKSFFPNPEENQQNANILESVINKLGLFESEENKEIITEKINQLEALINKLTGSANNSKKIGIFGENYIHELISKNFIGMSYTKTGETDHAGDGLITLSNGKEILVEVKNYQTIVNDDEIDKFTFDMKTTKRKFGLFISINSKINKSKIIDLRTFTYENETYYQFFISNLSEDLHRLEVGLLILQLLSEYKDHKNNQLIIDETIKEKLNTLIEHLNENEKLRGMYLDTEKDIRNSLNNFYQKLRDNHLTMENKIKNILTYIKDNKITNVPEKEVKDSIVLKKYKDTKIYNILKKTIDYLDNSNHEYKETEKEIGVSNIGIIKIFTNKLVLNTKSKLTITINDDNWELFEKQFIKN